MKKLYRRDPSIMILTACFTVGILVQVFFSIDILPPCLFKVIFHTHCPGCGITTAATHLVRFEFLKAWNSNPLIYLVAPYFAFEIFLFLRSLFSKKEVVL